MAASDSSERVIYSRRQSMSPPRTPVSRAESKSPPRMPGPRAESQSPPRPNFFRTESRSPPRSTEHRAESKSPPTVTEDRAQSTSPPRSEGHKSRSESKSPLNQIEEDMTQMTFTGRSRQRDSSDPQSAGSEKTQNSGRTRVKHRRATPTPSQRPAPAESDLHAACWTRNMAAVKRILSQDQSDIDGGGGLLRMTPVMTAAFEGQVDVVKILVSEGADVSLVDEDGNNILHYACGGGDVETVKCVLSLHVADINSRGVGSRTPVMEAARWGHRDVVELLVSEGADVSLVDEDGNNTLHHACWGGDVETVKYVLSLHVADINSRGRRSRTPVMAAAVGGHRDVVEFLVSEGADVSLVDKVGNNILHYACVGGDVETLKCVLSQNVADINSRGRRSRTPVMMAAYGEHRDVVELLASEGADVSMVDGRGDNILHLACRGGDVETVKFVLSQNVVDIDARNNAGQTAADVARDGGHQEVVKLL